MNLFGFLLCSLLFLNTTLRFFTNHLRILPKMFNIIDIIFVGLFVLLFVGRKHGLAREGKLIGRLVVFNFILILGALLNMDFFYAPAAMSQIIMWNEPIILFLILVNLPFSRRDFAAFNKLLIFLIIFEFALGLLQVLVYLQTGESEAITGTFQGNAEQYGAFLMMGMLYLMGQAHVEPSTKTRNSIFIIGMLILIMLIDNKASWLGIALSSFYLLHRLGQSIADARHWMKYICVFVMLFGLALLVVVKSSGTLHKYTTIKQAWVTGNVLNLGKF